MIFSNIVNSLFDWIIHSLFKILIHSFIILLLRISDPIHSHRVRFIWLTHSTCNSISSNDFRCTAPITHMRVSLSPSLPACQGQTYFKGNRNLVNSGSPSSPTQWSYPRISASSWWFRVQFWFLYRRFAYRSRLLFRDDHRSRPHPLGRRPKPRPETHGPSWSETSHGDCNSLYSTLHFILLLFFHNFFPQLFLHFFLFFHSHVYSFINAQHLRLSHQI